MTKGFWIHITNNLLEKKHQKAMGSAIWEFMWCLDKMTKIDYEKGIGVCLGGKPIKAVDIAKDIGKHPQKIRTNIKKLRNAGYLKTKRTPYGTIIAVNKAKKKFSTDKPITVTRVTDKGLNKEDSKQDNKQTGNKYFDDDIFDKQLARRKIKAMEKEPSHIKDITGSIR